MFDDRHAEHSPVAIWLFGERHCSRWEVLTINFAPRAMTSISAGGYWIRERQLDTPRVRLSGIIVDKMLASLFEAANRLRSRRGLTAFYASTSIRSFRSLQLAWSHLW